MNNKNLQDIEFKYGKETYYVSVVHMNGQTIYDKYSSLGVMISKNKQCNYTIGGNFYLIMEDKEPIVYINNTNKEYSFDDINDLLLKSDEDYKISLIKYAIKYLDNKLNSKEKYKNRVVEIYLK